MKRSEAAAVALVCGASACAFLPSIAGQFVWAPLIAVGLERLPGIARAPVVRVVRAGAVAAVALFAALSSAQSQIWRDTETLYTAMLDRLGDDPYRVDIDLHLAQAYRRRGDRAGEANALDAALAADPRRYRDRYRPGTPDGELNNLVQAIRNRRDALRRGPGR